VLKGIFSVSITPVHAQKHRLTPLVAWWRTSSLVHMKVIKHCSREAHNSYSRVQANIRAFTGWKGEKHFFYIFPILAVCYILGVFAAELQKCMLALPVCLKNH
jgi:hypothetical protein